ncbi:MAG: CDP-6-deoxy-delta-3,4-glucoseen reductase [Gammaproteobacteria bacterium]|nr:CDP-6-deoxy-delta-3,4-glucoseen reductase [Gammaproteobacteria bacterium]
MTFKIKIQPSGIEFTAEEGETVVEAARFHDIPMPFSCLGGSCGSCKGKILSGQIRYEEDMLPALSETEKGLNMSLFCQAIAESDLEIEIRSIGVTKDIVVKTLPCRVAQMNKLAPDVMQLFLKLPMVEEFNYLPGQYLDILWRDGRRRSFSIANVAKAHELLEQHVRQIDGGAFTDFVFNEMSEKALLRFEGPLGTFYFREDSPAPKIFIAGGTGFAPMKAMLEQAFALERTEPLYLYWGVRDLQSLYMKELPQQWAEAHENFHFIPVLSEPKEADLWSGRTGFVHQAVLNDFKQLNDFQIYASGPPAMIDAARDTFLQKGMLIDDFFSDPFNFSIN